MKPIGEVKDAGFGLGTLGFLNTPLPIGTLLYTADQLREVEQQRDELINALMQIHANADLYSAETIEEIAHDAIVRVKP